MNNYWHTYSSDLVVWEVRLPQRPTDPEYRRWERTFLDAGEAHAVYQVAETLRRRPFTYERGRDGYLAEVLDARPELLNPPGEDARLVFSFGLLAGARLAYVDIHDQIREAETVYLPELPDIKAHPDQRWDAQAPLKVLAGVDDKGIWAVISTTTTIWLPWQPNLDWRFDAPDDALLDNHALAERHTPRLNTFLSDIADAAQRIGGWLRLDRNETIPELLPFVTDHGVHMDFPNTTTGLDRGKK